MFFAVSYESVLISIHAPQWGATSMAWPVSSAAAYFNPRTPVGCDTGVERILFEHGEFQSTHPSGVRRYSESTSIFHLRFQSTHPSGVRPSLTTAGPATTYFNPRTPVGCDLLEISIRGNLVVISIHAPQWGATTCIFMLRHIFYISIHAPPWGATRRSVPR